MKVAVSAVSENLDAQINPRFGRCQYFIIIETDNMQFEAIPNVSQNAPSGAGIQAAQNVANKGIQVVLTGNVGPNASQVLSSAGIKIVTGVSGTVREAVERYKNGQLQSMTTPTAMGLGTGRGFGMGMGRGRGGGRGMGRMFATGQYVPQTPMNIPIASTYQMSKEQEIQMLETQMKAMQQQLDQIRKRLEELK